MSTHRKPKTLLIQVIPRDLSDFHTYQQVSYNQGTIAQQAMSNYLQNWHWSLEDFSYPPCPLCLEDARARQIRWQAVCYFRPVVCKGKGEEARRMSVYAQFTVVFGSVRCFPLPFACCQVFYATNTCTHYLLIRAAWLLWLIAGWWIMGRTYCFGCLQVNGSNIVLTLISLPIAHFPATTRVHNSQFPFIPHFQFPFLFIR